MRRGHVPIRTCLGCGRRRPQAELRRLVLVRGQLRQRGEQPGRSVYCCPDDGCWQRLQKKKKLLRRAFRLGD